MNIAFHYLYRDGANYKNLNTIIFKNPTNMDLETFSKILIDKLISEEYFYANKWQIPDMHFGSWDSEIDHEFHQFEAIEYTDEVPNSILTLTEFIELINEA